MDDNGNEWYTDLHGHRQINGVQVYVNDELRQKEKGCNQRSSSLNYTVIQGYNVPVADHHGNHSEFTHFYI